MTPEERRVYMKRYRADDRVERNERMKRRRSELLNNLGLPKANVRTYSNLILLKNHTKLQGYQIHHCFTYDDPNRFIYIPKYLHLQIHRLLRDKKIPADSDHWNVIKDLVNSCEDYTYIRD